MSAAPIRPRKMRRKNQAKSIMPITSITPFYSAVQSLSSRSCTCVVVSLIQYMVQIRRVVGYLFFAFVPPYSAILARILPTHPRSALNKAMKRNTVHSSNLLAVPEEVVLLFANLDGRAAILPCVPASAPRAKATHPSPTIKGQMAIGSFIPGGSAPCRQPTRPWARACRPCPGRRGRRPAPWPH